MNDVNTNTVSNALVATLIMLSLLLSGCGSLAVNKSSGTARPLNLSAGGRPTPSVGGKAAENIVSTLWEEQYGYVRIERAERNAPVNDHPVSFTAEQVRQLLNHLQVEKGTARAKTVFDAKELDDISQPIALALANAGTDEDVTFAVAGQKGPITFMKKRLLTTGRIFNRDGMVNIIFGLVHAEFEDQFKATGILRGFTPGSRAGRIETRWNISSTNPAVQYASDRKDWVRISDQAGIIVAQKTETPVRPKAVSEQEAAPLSDQTVSPPSRRIKPDYQDLEQRLEVLKRLRGRDLITEKEYQQKRQAILNQL